MKISYEELLDVFWNSHNPASSFNSTQYRSVVFYHDESQHQLALSTKKAIEEKTGRRVTTEIAPYSAFYLAEDYHQKYYLRQVSQLRKEFNTIYPDYVDFVNSTAAARINGFIGGNGTVAALKELLPDLGLSPRASEDLLSIGLRRLPATTDTNGPSCPVEG